jgi:hypothetical protein
LSIDFVYVFLLGSIANNSTGLSKKTETPLLGLTWLEIFFKKKIGLRFLLALLT